MNYHYRNFRQPWKVIRNCYDRYIFNDREALCDEITTDSRVLPNNPSELHTMITILNNLHSLRPALKANYVINTIDALSTLRVASGGRGYTQLTSLTSSDGREMSR
jgi:hypothetical protein